MAVVAFKAVHQTDFSPGRGNALQAAVASILSLELNQVPNFIEMPNGYDAAIREFCQEQHGLNCIKINLVVESSNDSRIDVINIQSTAVSVGGKLCVLRGKSPRGDFGHVVVAKKRMGNTDASNQQFEMVHDPHPDSTFLDESEAFGWCMFFV